MSPTSEINSFTWSYKQKPGMSITDPQIKIFPPDIKTTMNFWFFIRIFVLGDGMHSCRCKPKLQRNLLPPSSGKNVTHEATSQRQQKGNRFFWNLYTYLPNYKALCPRRRLPLKSKLWEPQISRSALSFVTNSQALTLRDKIKQRTQTRPPFKNNWQARACLCSPREQTTLTASTVT